MQVCTTDADVKRALNAWAAYGNTSQRPIDAFNQGLPRKHTLVDLWGKAASSSGGSKKRNINTSAIQAAPKVGETAADERPPRGCPARRGQALTATSKDEQPASSSGPQGITKDHSNLAGNRQQSKPSTQPGQDRAVTDAFSMLLSSAKAPAAVPKKEFAARPPGATRPRDGAWQDVLHQVAMHPERWAHDAWLVHKPLPNIMCSCAGIPARSRLCSCLFFYGEGLNDS